MSEQKKILLYRMTHINNVPHILQHGVTHKTSVNANPDFSPIGDISIINHRNSFILNNGKELGDYIPFYFGPRMPMLYVIQKGYNNVPAKNPENIVYCVTSVENMSTLTDRFVFTNGHAIDTLSEQFHDKDISNIADIIDWDAVNTKDWKKKMETDLDVKRRMQAEFLVGEDIPYNSILGFVVYNEIAEEQLLNFGVSPEQIRKRMNFYF